MDGNINTLFTSLATTIRNVSRRGWHLCIHVGGDPIRHHPVAAPHTSWRWESLQ